jgi:hypothetical protein
VEDGEREGDSEGEEEPHTLTVAVVLRAAEPDARLALARPVAVAQSLRLGDGVTEVEAEIVEEAVPLPRRPAVAVAALSAAEIVIEGEGERVKSCVAVMLPERELERVKDGDGVALFEREGVEETDDEGEDLRDADPAPPEDGV